MKKFFSVGSWGKGQAPLKFASVPNIQQANSTKRKKKPKSQQTQEDPATTQATIKKNKSIIKGRIEKKKQNDISKAPLALVSKTTSEFQAKLKDSLVGGRFRFINEQLYTMPSQSAVELFKQDKCAFEAYHNGYKHQVQQWPMNPLNRIIKSIKKLPKDFVVGDFGCGEGKLAQSLPNKVFSIDLVSDRQDIIACDMADTPLETGCLNVAVYCLSLMGTNLNDFLLEANRCLKKGGLLLIADIQSRFDDINQFVKAVEKCGFTLTKKDSSVKLFCFFDFKKVRNVDKDTLLPTFSLNPCVYKKR